MSLFSQVKHSHYLNEHGNFEGFLISIMLLYRMTTGENWNGVMRDCMIQPPFCTSGQDCGDA